MKILISTLVLFALSSCGLKDMKNYESYQTRATREFNELERPVILFSKTDAGIWDGYFNIVVKDGKGELHDFSNACYLARSIGQHYQIGDTLK